jgi:UDP-GlcNAc3NAcA epimerase
MKIATIVGARPQFIKAATVTRALIERGNVDEIIIHTGQHFDERMSDIFFQELNIPKPTHNLDIHGGRHGEMTGRMMIALESVITAEKPDCLLIYGDTNSTLAGALVAAKLNIPIAHVEAGLRSFNRAMPEEVNRIVADRLSELLFCPSETAVTNLANEGMEQGVFNVGDVMYDAALHFSNADDVRDRLSRDLSIGPKGFFLVTCHRAENTDDPLRLRAILEVLDALAASEKIVMPMHPRTHNCIEKYGFAKLTQKLTLIPPASYAEMMFLASNAKKIITDSGGLQKEAFFFRVPCITIRDETEWVETVTLGWNQIVGADRARLLEAVASPTAGWDETSQPYGDGQAAHKIAERLAAHFGA